jgi:hypothetical protein
LTLNSTKFSGSAGGFHFADHVGVERNENPDDAPLEVIKEAYKNHVMENWLGFNATLFRFLLKRLGKQRDSFAAQHCITLLEPNPEETQNILKYFSSVGPGEDVEAQIIESMNSGELVYQYQIYQIVEWFYERSSGPSESLLDLVRKIGFDQTSPRYLKTICRAFLGKFGISADLERMVAQYDETNDPSERAEIICSISRMERGRRNAFLARVERDGPDNPRAVRWAKSQG